MVVMKFGGTSVADEAAIGRLMEIVARQREKDTAAGDPRPGPVVVVSALSGVTDRLLGVAAEAGAGDSEGARHNLRDLRARHLAVAAVDATLRVGVRLVAASHGEAAAHGRQVPGIAAGNQCVP